MQEMRNTSYSHKKERACPFFLSKEIIESADILSMPYNYLLDPMMHKANNLELPNTIIIPDEAHNVKKTCEESASMQIRPTDKACIDNIKYVDYEGDGPLGGYNEAKKNFTIDDLALLKEMQLERTGTCIFEIFDNITSKEVITYHVVAHLCYILKIICIIHAKGGIRRKMLIGSKPCQVLPRTDLPQSKDVYTPSLSPTTSRTTERLMFTRFNRADRVQFQLFEKFVPFPYRMPQLIHYPSMGSCTSAVALFAIPIGLHRTFNSIQTDDCA
ncbi:regulator of telomere elongation helicase 1 homolog [Armigeres subalbatus]|uniref:regulator of telomere elongation helicase 1 homolog n=1 Tax=Armigeres subalbatus TaxID=124917 RepID=UPI002ED608A3